MRAEQEREKKNVPSTHHERWCAWREVSPFVHKLSLIA